MGNTKKKSTHQSIKMKNLLIKCKEIFIPYLLVSIGTIFLYNTFRWFFGIKLGILPFKEGLWDLWIPFAISLLTTYIWLRPRIRILKMSTKYDNGYFVLRLFMAASIVIPISFSQEFITKASYDLVQLNTADEILQYKNEKYFEIDSFKVDKNSKIRYVNSRIYGKSNRRLKFHLYLACSFENSEQTWYGVKYEKEISNRLSKEQKQKEYRAFMKQSLKEFKLLDMQNVTYFDKLGHTDDRDGFLNAIEKKNPGIKAKEQIVLVPKQEDFDKRFVNTFSLLFNSFGIGSLIIFLFLLVLKVDKKGLQNFRGNKSIKDESVEDFKKLFDFRKPKTGITILIVLNVLVFIVMLFLGINITSPTAQELFEVGGSRRVAVLNGDYWRLLTSIFIHGGITHLVMNMVGIAIGGIFLENVLGKYKLILIFMVCGILASLCSIYWNEYSVNVGASGAIFGCYGIILAFNVFKIYPKYLQNSIWSLLGLFGGISLIFGFVGGADNAAHIGGLLAGFLIGSVLLLIQRNELTKKAETSL